MPRPTTDPAGEAMQSISFRLPQRYVEALDRDAAARGLTRGELLRRLIERAGLVPAAETMTARTGQPRPALERREVTPRPKTGGTR